MGLFMLLTLWQWIKSRKPATFETQKYFTALLEGMKPKWICRSYYLVFLIRRTLFVAIIFFMQDIDMIYRVASFVAVQALLLIYILALRPQDGFKENFIDVINETFYLYFGAFMLYYNSEQTWTSTTTDVYFWILMANNFALMLISFVSMIVMFAGILKRIFCKRNKVSQQITTKVEILNPQIEINDDKPNQLMTRKGGVYEDTINNDNLPPITQNNQQRIEQFKSDRNLTTSKDDLVSNPTNQNINMFFSKPIIIESAKSQSYWNKNKF